MSNRPQSHYCPITHDIMKNPYMDIYGNSYEYESIKQWIEDNHNSPINRKPLELSQIFPNRALLDIIEEFTNNPSSSTNNTNSYLTKITPQLSLNAYTSKVNPSSNEYYGIINIESKNIGQRKPAHIICGVDVSGSMGINADLKSENGATESYNLTLLDLNKHGLKTLINCLQEQDYFTLITYSDYAKVIFKNIRLTNKNKPKCFSAIEKLDVEGRTNLWDGLKSCLDVANETENFDINTSIFLMTDGKPNIEPGRGTVGAFKFYKDRHPNLICTVNTFGIGPEVDPLLLTNLCNEGNGTFGYIHDASMMGTIIINKLSNHLTNISASNVINITIPDGCTFTPEFIKNYNYVKTSWGTQLYLGPINSGQSRDLVFTFLKFDDSDIDPMFEVNLKCNSLTENNIYQCNSQPLPNDKKSLLFNNLSRLYTCNTLISLTDSNRNDINQSQVLVKNAIEQLKRYNVLESEYINDLIKDYDQIGIAVSRMDWFKKWGDKHIRSLFYAHRYQECNNFKDPGVQHYGGEDFGTYRDDADEIFNDMPAPKPKVSQYLGRGGNCRGGHLTSSTPSSMAVYNSSARVCFHGSSQVLMQDNSNKEIYNIKKGDLVKTPSGYAKIECVIISPGSTINTPLCDIDGLLITPYHPVLVECDWKFPIDIVEAQNHKLSRDYLYNFVLSNDHIIVVNGIQCCTLGHGITGNDVINHEFFGTDKVINCLKNKPGYNKGLVELNPFETIRDKNTNKIISI